MEDKTTVAFIMPKFEASYVDHPGAIKISVQTLTNKNTKRATGAAIKQKSMEIFTLHTESIRRSGVEVPLESVQRE